MGEDEFSSGPWPASYLHIRKQTLVLRGALNETACDPYESDELPGLGKSGCEAELPKAHGIP